MIQVYTGEGKGKTTAAFGLALRALGAGLRVYVAQFIKNGSFCEIKTIKTLKNIEIEQFGLGCFIRQTPSEKEMKLVSKGFAKIKKIISEKFYDVIILDEANIVLDLKMINLADFLNSIKSASKNKEIILTGRNAPKELIRLADLVSEIKEIKHYYKKGIKARKGIEF
ncbi:MAG: cob(I)yrinic acid a,c-diamide adenosyltransferase [Candidatus Omnitrophota bacterium]